MRTDPVGLMTRARGGDGDAFRELIQRYHRELQVHCYRMLGSVQDAEDAMQDTLLAAWQHLDAFGDRSSLRTWLYRIATNKCLDARRSAARRPAVAWNVPGVEPPVPSRSDAVVWLEPWPDAVLPSRDEPVLGPEARYERKETVSLAFITALQLLPPRQVAVLVLRDVLGFPAADVAAILGSTVESVTSALTRARAGLAQQWTPDRDRTAPVAGSEREQALLARFVAAWESADVAALVQLLTDDVTISMPPMPFQYDGRERVAEFCATLFAAGRRFDLVATRANGQPAFGAYLRSEHGPSHGVGLYVLSLSGDRICAMTRFENTVLPFFGLPRRIVVDRIRPAGRP